MFYRLLAGEEVYKGKRRAVFMEQPHIIRELMENCPLVACSTYCVIVLNKIYTVIPVRCVHRLDAGGINSPPADRPLLLM
jgi:hypothetical protein